MEPVSYTHLDVYKRQLFDKYERRALEEKNVLFGGRLGMYRYMDMDKVIEEALNMAETEPVSYTHLICDCGDRKSLPASCYSWGERSRFF